MHNNLLLQNYVFIPLDIFKANLHNKDINSKLDAWLTFLCMDEPEWIIKVIEAYPQFKAMYRQVYEMCLNVERVMTMFSSELRELDRNTVHYMIDEMQDTIDSQKKTIDTQQDTIDSQKGMIDSQKDTIVSQKGMIDAQRLKLSKMEQELLELRKKLNF